MPERAWPPVTPTLPLLREPTDAIQGKTRQPSHVSRHLYLLLALIPILLVSAVLLVRTGFLANPVKAGRTPWDLAIILLGGAVTVAMAILVARRAPHLYGRGNGMACDSALASAELATLLGTIPVAFVFSGMAFVAWSGRFGGVPVLQDAMAGSVLAALAILAACGPTAAFHAVRESRIRAMEERFPDFLRDLNESHAAGMTMAQAIRAASRGDYGRLNDEIRRMAIQVSWGASFPDALRMFRDRVGTPLVTRAVTLIVKATQAGGNVKDVLAAAARDAREIKAIEADRRLGMTLYVIVIYVAFAVFLGVTAALQGLLIPSVLHSTQAVSGAPALAGFSFNTGMTLTDFRSIYFSVGIVQAIGSGVVAGVMSEGNLVAGLKHGVILVAITLVILGLLL